MHLRPLGIRAGNLGETTSNDAILGRIMRPVDTSGMISAYLGDIATGQLLDSSGAGRDATIVGTVTAAPDGPFPSTLTFDGSSSITLPSGSFVSGTGSRTISLWFYVDSMPASTQVLFGSGNAVADHSFDLVITATGVGVDVYGGFNGSPYSYVKDVSGRWNHLAAVYNNATNGISLRLNGAVVASGTNANILTYSTGQLGNGVTGAYFAGQLGNVRVYNSALDAESVSLLANEPGSMASHGIEDNPTDGNTTDGISSNWAYDHVNAADPHAGYMLESAAQTTITDSDAHYPTSGAVVDWAPKLTANTVVTLTNSMTAAEIQAEIDAQPKNLNGYVLTFQFADGTYTLSSGLDFFGFYGGELRVNGNSSDSSKSTSKNVTLDFSGIATEDWCLNFMNCSCRCTPIYLHVKCKTSVGSKGVHFSTCAYGLLYFSYVEGDTKADGECINYVTTLGFVGETYVDGSRYPILVASGSSVRIHNCAYSTVQPEYGITGSSGIAFRGGAEIVGATSGDTEINGGRVFT